MRSNVKYGTNRKIVIFLKAKATEYFYLFDIIYRDSILYEKCKFYTIYLSDFLLNLYF